MKKAILYILSVLEDLRPQDRAMIENIKSELDGLAQVSVGIAGDGGTPAPVPALQVLPPPVPEVPQPAAAQPIQYTIKVAGVLTAEDRDTLACLVEHLKAQGLTVEASEANMIS